MLPVFHWPLRFPEIAARGGFDCVLGNPPWEQFESRERAWFGEHAPELAALPGAARKRAIATLAARDPGLAQAWRQHVSANARRASYARDCGRFTPTGGKPNTYLLFAELFADLLVRSTGSKGHVGDDARDPAADGRAGVILKSGFGLDASASPVFRRLNAAGRVCLFHDFVNGGPGGRIFPAVGGPVRFAVVGLTGARATTCVDVSTYNFTVAQARRRPAIALPRALLRRFNPETHTLICYREADEYRVATRLHRAHAPLACGGAGPNPWALRFAQLFNIAGKHRDMAQRPADLERDGWRRGRDNVYRRGPGERALPLYEGQLANRYDHRARTYAGFGRANKYGRKPRIPATTDAQKADPAFEIEPRYWLIEQTAMPRIERIMGARALVGIRDIATWYSDQRCAKAALLPRYPCAHTIPVLGVPRARALEFVAVFNSTTFDFLVCGHLPANHVALLWMLAQLPAPAPGLDARVAEGAARLSLTSHAVARPFARAPCVWEPHARRRDDAEVDALVAHGYGLTRREYETVLDSFHVLARAELRAHGRYRFKDDCLRAYARVA